MGIAERREREKEQLRTLIIEAARDLLSEKGLDALSVRAIAKAIEYSPATIYLYFKDKSDLIQSVVAEGFRRLGVAMRDELAVSGASSSAATSTERLMAVSRAYVQFALDNTAYFRVMFELPTVACMECPEPLEGEVAMTDEQPWAHVVSAARDAVERGEIADKTPEQVAVLGWGVLHGLTSLYLGGHLRGMADTPQALWALVDAGLSGLFGGSVASETAVVVDA